MNEFISSYVLKNAIIFNTTYPHIVTVIKSSHAAQVTIVSGIQCLENVSLLTVGTDCLQRLYAKDKSCQGSAVLFTVVYSCVY